jgi:leukotriene-A4 hydrolase
LAIQRDYEIAFPRLTEYLKSIGREKLIKPLYEELVKSPEGRQRAQAIYQVARPTYHPIVTRKLDKLLNA